MHTPQTLYGILELLRAQSLSVKHAYIVGFQILADADRTYTHNEITLTTEDSGIKGWKLAHYQITSERTFSELTPTMNEMYRCIASFGLVGSFTPIKYHAGNVYGIWRIESGSVSLYNSSMFVTNRVGEFAYDKDGKLGKILSAQETNTFNNAFPAQQISMMTNGLPMHEAAVSVVQTTSLIKENWIKRILSVPEWAKSRVV